MEISVVIPTRGRPEMVQAAVWSALRQTLAPKEVIVVVDGPEPGGVTAAGLRALGEERVRVLELAEAVGGAEARNCGVRAASGDWIAFLDDDDLWLPEKLAAQREMAAGFSSEMDVVLSCRVIARSPTGEEVWPRRVYAVGEPMGEYLFCRDGWRYGERLLQTSTLVAPRRLLLQEPFTAGLKKHQDWDWLLRVAAGGSARVVSCGTVPLVVFHVGGERASVGRVRDWRFSLGWALGWRRWLGEEGLSGFVATECAPQLRGESVWRRLGFLAAVLRGGYVVRRDWVRLMGFLWIPVGMRNWLRARLAA